jgi:hypothetical protein
MRFIKLYYKADLRIIDGVATDGNSDPVFLPPGTVTTAIFYDAREAREVCVTQVDVDKLRQSGLAGGEVVYVGSELPSPPYCFGGVRLVNGAQLPAGGMTVVSHHPLYVQGDYNVVDKQPAALIGDALTVLSGAWNDADSRNPTNSRRASDTTLNSAVMAGRTQTPGHSQFLVRFLERWTNETFTFTGSEISTWESEEVSSELACCGNGGAYEPPTRVWSFDTSFLNALLPPGTPVAYTTTSVVWYQE